MQSGTPTPRNPYADSPGVAHWSEAEQAAPGGAAIARESVQIWQGGDGVGGFWLVVAHLEGAAINLLRNTVEPTDRYLCVVKMYRYTVCDASLECPYEVPMSECPAVHFWVTLIGPGRNC